MIWQLCGHENFWTTVPQRQSKLLIPVEFNSQKVDTSILDSCPRIDWCYPDALFLKVKASVWCSNIIMLWWQIILRALNSLKIVLALSLQLGFKLGLGLCITVFGLGEVWFGPATVTRWICLWIHNIIEHIHKFLQCPHDDKLMVIHKWFIIPLPYTIATLRSGSSSKRQNATWSCLAVSGLTEFLTSGRLIPIRHILSSLSTSTVLGEPVMNIRTKYQ